jgi:5-formyltetrahydrofolate cyclo-ligase
MDGLPDGDAAPSEAIGRAKQALRARCRRVRDELGDSRRAQASERICERIREWSAFRSATVVFTYLPMRGEVDLRPLLDEASRIRWAIPRVVEAPTPHLLFHAYQRDHLILHRFGMPEPDPGAPLITPDQADLILVPGLAFDWSGFRIGYGGGYYDRLLAQHGHAMALGICYQALLLDEIPHEAHDVPVGHLVTEACGVILGRGVA